jgi:hypothetical protein
MVSPDATPFAAPVATEALDMSIGTSPSLATPDSPAPAPSPSVSPLPPSPLPRPAPVTGILRLLVVPESRVIIDGASLGLLSRRELPLAPGTHTVRVEHPDYQPLQRRVTIREGDTESLVIDLAEKGIRRSY